MKKIIASFWNGNQRISHAEVESVRYDDNGSAHYTFNVGGEQIEVPSTRVSIERVLPDPDACYVCNHGPHATGAHEYVSNAAAEAHFAAEDAKMQAPVYSSGARTPEAAYVAQHRPY
jgi:hypothetical protein